MAPHYFPYPVAVFSDRFIFTTLDQKDVIAHRGLGYCHPQTKVPCSIFSREHEYPSRPCSQYELNLLVVDEEMQYIPFAMDHGPFNLAFTYHACVRIHDRLESSEKHRPVCLYTSCKAETKSNIALLAALYFVIVVHGNPWKAFEAVAQLEVMPFRDAGKGPMDFGISIQVRHPVAHR